MRKAALYTQVASRALSFLYCTRTILSRPSPWRPVPLRALKIPTAGAQISNIPFKGQPELENDEHTDYLENVLRLDREARSASTLTPAERATFSRISGPRKRDDTIAPAEENGALELDNPGDGDEDLAQLFDRFEREDSSDSTGTLLRLLPTLSLSGDEAQLIDRLFAPDMTENEDSLRAACVEHRHRVEKMLDSAKTDAEIWKLLETEVYSLIEQVKGQFSHEQKGLSSRSTKKSKKRANTAAQEALTSPKLLAILQSNYAALNLRALRLWRRRYPSSPHALQVLPRLRSLGPISHVMAASTGLYNEALFLRWTRYRDLRGVADLLEEMHEPDELTLRFLRHVDRERRRDLSGANGTAMGLWWEMAGVREEWERVRRLYPGVKASVGKKASQLAEDQTEHDGWVELEAPHSPRPAADDSTPRSKPSRRVEASKNAWSLANKDKFLAS